MSRLKAYLSDLVILKDVLACDPIKRHWFEDKQVTSVCPKEEIAIVVRTISKAANLSWKTEELDAFRNHCWSKFKVRHCRLRLASRAQLRVAAIKIHDKGKALWRYILLPCVQIVLIMLSSW